MTAAALTLDFTPRRRDRWQTIGIAALLLGVVCAFGAAAILEKDAAKVQLARNARDAAAERVKKAQIHDRDLSSDPAIAVAVKRDDKVLDALSVPWNDFFSMIEGAGTRNIAILQLVPDPHSQSVRIGGEAKSMDEVLKYVSRLGGQPMLHQVHLVSYQSGQRDGTAVVQFLIVATWP